MYAYDVFPAIEKVIIDYVLEQTTIKFLNDVKIAKKLHRENVMTAILIPI